MPNLLWLACALALAAPSIAIAAGAWLRRRSAQYPPAPELAERLPAPEPAPAPAPDIDTPDADRLLLNYDQGVRSE